MEVMLPKTPVRNICERIADYLLFQLMADAIFRLSLSSVFLKVFNPTF